MQTGGKIRRFMLTLPGICRLLAIAIAVLVIGGGQFISGSGTALAKSAQTAVSARDCTEDHQKPSFGSTVVVSSGEVVCGSLTSFGGTMIVQGEVKGDIVSFNGSVLIGGLVEGNVTLYGGDLTLQNSARVNGNIHVCGGQWIEGTESRLHGNVFDCTESVSFLLPGDGGPTFRFWSVLTWVALALLLTTLLPEHVMLVRTTLQYKKRRSLVLGLLSVLLAPVVIVILIALIIPIPLAIIVAIGLLAAWALGTVAVGWSIGEYLLRIIAPQQHTRPLQVIVGSAVLALAGSLPYVGWVISLAAGLVGLGAVLLSRFGTRLYAPPRQPLPL